MTRVLYVEGNEDGTVGGSYHSLALLVEALDRSQWEPIVVFYHENAIAERLRSKGIEVRILPAPGTLTRAGKARQFWKRTLAPVRRQLRFLRDQRISLVHLNNSVRTNLSWMLAAWLGKLPCLTHQRGMQPSGRLAIRWFAKRLGAVICISEAVKQHLLREGIPGTKLFHIANGIAVSDIKVLDDAATLKKMLEIPATARIVVMVGNFKAWKGQLIVVRALSEIVRQAPDVVCVFVGDTSAASAEYAGQVRQEAESLGLENQVRFVGVQKNPFSYVAAAELLVHASIQPEPFGRVLIEAMALAKPVVATAGGGASEIVVDGSTGFLVPPGDASALSKAIISLLVDPHQAAAFGRAGLARVQEHFDFRVTARRVQDLYCELMERSSSGH